MVVTAVSPSSLAVDAASVTVPSRRVRDLVENAGVDSGVVEGGGWRCAVGCVRLLACDADDDVVWLEGDDRAVMEAWHFLARLRPHRFHKDSMLYDSGSGEGLSLVLDANEGGRGGVINSLPSSI